MRAVLLRWVLTGVLRRLAADTLCRVGAGLGVLAFAIGVRRQAARAQLQRALGVRGAPARRLLRRAYATIGAAFFEVWGVGGPDGPEGHLRLLAPTHCRRLARRGVVFVLPHQGCWDAAAGAWAASFGGIIAYAKQQRDPVVDAAVVAQRARLGIRVVWARRGDRRQAVGVLRDVRGGAALGLLADQRPSGDDGEPAEFLGHATLVNGGPGFFGSHGAALVPVLSVRTAAGRSVVLPLRPLPGAAAADLRQQAAWAMSAAIAAFPGQYFWMHKRLRDEPAVGGEQPWRRGLAWFRRT